MFWPVRLAAFYPHPNGQVPVWQLLCTIALLAAVTLVAIHWRKEHQYIFTGWFWYVGMLVPVIGLVQAGEQARADRYTYLPQIGLYILITWGVTDVIADVVTRKSGLRSVTNLKSMTSRSRVVRTNGPSAFDRRGELGRGKQRRSYRVPCAAMGTAIIMLLSWCAFVQTSYWNNSDALWNHALAVTGENDVAHQNLAFLFLQRRDSDSAIAHFATALKIRSHYGASHYNFGSALIENSLASVLLQKGRQSEAIEHYQKAMTLRPDYGDPYLNIGNVLLQHGRSDEAMAQWEKAITMEPRDAGFHTALGDAFLRLGMQQGAIAEYEQAVRVSAQDAVVRNNLAWLLATSSDTSIRNPNRAVELAQQAVRFSHGKNPNCVRTLAAAYAASGRFPEAQENARRALESAQRKGDSTLVTALRDEIALYELGLPYHR
jgi:tetratricopeptide (TPR) repeat protein